MTVDVRRATARRVTRFLAGIVMFALGALWASYLVGHNYFQGESWDTFFRVLPWALLVGVIIGLASGIGITLYNPFPRSLRGEIVFDKVELGKLWFHNPNGHAHNIALDKLVVTVHSDKIIHLGLPPKILVMETHSREDTAALCSALRGKVKTLRTYQEEAGSEDVEYHGT